jgi:hypothetical protein
MKLTENPDQQHDAEGSSNISTPQVEEYNFLKLRDAVKAGDVNEIKNQIITRVQELIEAENLENYLVLIIYDNHGYLSNFHSDRLYAASEGKIRTKDILLILHSRGGSIEPAYIISKTLKKLSANKFIVVVPRRAKSAATLLSLGADEIHMGLTSQLGPIDPQVGGLPALGLGNALDALADLACRFPGSAEVISRYLSEQLKLPLLGYFQRISESAVQYAERLLAAKNKVLPRTPHEIADHLVNHYKDHGFVIDTDESKNLLGPGIIKENTPEYRFGDEVFQELDLLEYMLSAYSSMRLTYVGSIKEGLNIERHSDMENKN